MNRRAIVAAALCVGVGAVLVTRMPAAPQPARAAEAVTAAAPAKPVPEPTSVDQDAPYFEACAREGLNESECIGRLIWFKATAGNERFPPSTVQQRIRVLIDRVRAR